MIIGYSALPVVAGDLRPGQVFVRISAPDCPQIMTDYVGKAVDLQDGIMTSLEPDERIMILETQLTVFR